MCKRQCAGDQEPLGDTMCRRSVNMKDRVNLYKRHVQEIREHEGQSEPVQEARAGDQGK